MGYVFYLRDESSLLLRAHTDRGGIEAYTGKGWRDFTDRFDPVHKDEPISQAEALELASQDAGKPVTMADLEAPLPEEGPASLRR
jgi:hypothetical protein